MPNLGITGHSNADASDNNFILWIKVTTASNVGGYTVDASNGCQSWNQAIGTAAGRWQCAIYTSSAGEPVTKLCSSTDTIGVSNGSTAGTNVSNAQLASCGTLAASTDYWIARNQNEAGIEPGYNGTTGCTSTTSGFTSVTYGTWGASPARTTTTSCWTLSINVTAVAGGGTPLKLNSSLSGLGASGSFFHDRLAT